MTAAGAGTEARVSSTRLRVFQLIAFTFICFAVIAAFYVGIARQLHNTFADQSWGRVQFAITAAITSLYHGGYGYTASNVVRTILINGGLTGEPSALEAIGVTFPDNLRNPEL